MNLSDGLVSLQCLCQLVGAGGLLHAAGNAFDAGDGLIDVHTFHQGADALQVAVAAAHELDALNLVVFHIEIDHLGAGTLGLELIHIKIPFCFRW